MKNPPPLLPPFSLFHHCPLLGGFVMSTHARKVAQELRALADDIATGDRQIGAGALAWYHPSEGVVPKLAAEWDIREMGRIPIVPRAIHDVLCPSMAILIHDELEEILICDRCKLAVENGAA